MEYIIKTFIGGKESGYYTFENEKKALNFKDIKQKQGYEVIMLKKRKTD